MAMVLGVGGSPRKNGNSDQMLRSILQGAEEAGATTVAIFLREYSFSSCIGCERCRRDKACTGLLDGMQLLYPLVMEAKGLVLASPTHNYNVTAWMKAFIDRLYAFYDFTDETPRGYSSRLAGQGRKAVYAAVCEQAEEEGMGLTIPAMELAMTPHGYETVGVAKAELLFHSGKIREHPGILDRCRDMGRNLGRELGRDLGRDL